MSHVLGFRRAQLDDVEFLIDLRVATMNDHLIKAGIFMNRKQHSLRIKEFFTDSHIILKDQQAIGLLKIGVLPQSLHIRQFQILPNYHGLGIGSKVLDVVKRKAQALKIPVTLNVLLENPAKKLYLRHGFVVTAENDLEFQMKWQ